MKIIKELLKIKINNKYMLLIILTVLTLFIGRIITHLIQRKINKSEVNKFKYKVFNFIKIVINIIEILVIYLLWENNIKNIITLISFISAAITLSLKDIIFNLFSGIYIRINKPFILEDRIEINNFKGDVINIGTFSFEILEIKEEYGNQSSGIIITIPNSTIFSHPIKNLNKGFDYIWDEIVLKLHLDCDIINNKKIICRIINNLDIIKNASIKMKKQIKNNTNYRMYYNKYDPVIYTELDNNRIILKIRYLVNPKKSRIIKSTLYNEILKEYKNGSISLIKE